MWSLSFIWAGLSLSYYPPVIFILEDKLQLLRLGLIYVLPQLCLSVHEILILKNFYCISIYAQKNM